MAMDTDTRLHSPVIVHEPYLKISNFELFKNTVSIK